MQKWRALNEIKLSSDGANPEGHRTPEHSSRSHAFSNVLEQAQANLKSQEHAYCKNLQTEFLTMECYQYTPIANSQNIIQLTFSNQEEVLEARVTPISQVM